MSSRLERGNFQVNSVPSRYVGGHYGTRDTSSQYSEGECKKWKLLLFCSCAISSYMCARYLQFGYEFIVWMCLFTVEYICARKLIAWRHFLKRSACFVVGIFAVLFDVSLILGYHIHTGDRYAGLMAENYIAAYSYADFAAFIVMLPGLYAMMLYPVLASHCAKSTLQKSSRRVFLNIVSWQRVLVLALIIFVSWIPYLVTYWPGFIFPDSGSSIGQALGFYGYSNHHPVAYTLLLQFWLTIASTIGAGHAIGIGLSSIAQMIVMAVVFAYMVEWMVVRFNLRRIWYTALLLPFALTAYVATYGIALWKDPLFSVAIIVQTLCIADYVWSKGDFISHNLSWYLAFILSGIILVLFRNNGVFVFVVSVAAIAMLGIRWHKKALATWSSVVHPIISALIVLVVFAVFTGPVFSYLNVAPTEKVESVGVPLNQMARVAALNGDMSGSDKEYMNELLPIAEYKNVYRPCCTDLLKWDRRFNGDVLKKSLWEHWISMFVRNPRVYFEAWELQTFGFWAVNPGDVKGVWSWNISGGAPYNNNPEAAPEEFDIHFGRYNKSNSLTALFPEDEWSLPISWILWGILYLCILGCCDQRTDVLVIVMPSLALLGTLIIASPVYYWPRYGAASQFLAPLFVLLFLSEVLGPNWQNLMWSSIEAKAIDSIPS